MGMEMTVPRMAITMSRSIRMPMGRHWDLMKRKYSLMPPLASMWKPEVMRAQTT